MIPKCVLELPRRIPNDLKYVFRRRKMMIKLVGITTVFLQDKNRKAVQLRAKMRERNNKGQFT